jgi:hypothetical protein
MAFRRALAASPDFPPSIIVSDSLSGSPREDELADPALRGRFCLDVSKWAILGILRLLGILKEEFLLGIMMGSSSVEEPD